MNRIKEFLRYNKSSGEFFWIKKTHFNSRQKIGTKAGRIRKDGYVEIKVNQRYYQAHRVAWFMENGSLGNRQIDHINGNRSDNRISNLRLSSPRDNHNNRPCHRKGSLPGASFKKSKKSKPWQSRLAIKFKQIHIGYFETELLAHKAYLNKRKELGI